MEDLQAKARELREQLNELREKRENVLLDTKQAQRRHVTDLDNEGKYGITKFARTLLNVPDNLERALDSVKTDDLDENEDLRVMHASVGEVRHLVEKALADFGVHKMKALDDTFNPERHEAMFAMPVPGKEPNTIIHVMEPGYMLHDRTLRAARVGIVAK